MPTRLAFLSLQEGRLHEAWRLLEQALELGNAGSVLHDIEICGVFSDQAIVLCEWNRLDEAQDCAQQAVQIAEHIGESTQQFYAYGSLLRVALSRGELEQAWMALEQAERAGRDVGSPYLQAFVITVELACSSAGSPTACSSARRLWWALLYSLR